ncbi:MAG: peptidoglycan recognition family protein [Ignavibacteriales bacterium]|nr:peptidoglycan recognition family protein [Ignavibacteriales bacterium]
MFLFNKKIKILFLYVTPLIITGCFSSKSGVEKTSNEIIILPRSAWNALDPKPFPSQIPERITIHHEGEYLSPDANAAEKIKNTQIWCIGKERNWSDIPYHFLIDLKGNIYEGRNVFTAGETNTIYDPSGHLLLTCMGNFEEQEISNEQLNALINLTAFCCKKYQINPETIKSHRDYTETLCPGKNLYKYFQNGYIIKKVKEELANL